MLRLLQAFIQSAPQAVFQLYVLCRKGSFVLQDDLVILIAAITSLVSVVWSLVCYSKALRDLRENAQDLPCVGFTCQVLWRTFMLTARVVALVLFASHFQQWALVAVIGHWMLMALWLACQKTQFCVDDSGHEHPWKERLFNSVIAFIYVFSFFNTKEGMTRKRVVLFYSVMLVENSLLISMWYPNRNLSTLVTYAALAVVWGGFLLGAIFMVIYYKCYHHSHSFKGLFVRTKTFTLHGRKMYGLYFCCCCRLKKWDVAIYDCRESSDEPSVIVRQGQEQEHVINPEVHNQYEANLHWDNDDIQMMPLNGACVRGAAADLEMSSLVADDDDDVPDIIVTAASPLALSPQESVSKLSTEDPTTDVYLEKDSDDPPLSPGQTSLDKAREILASKLVKNIDSQSNDEVDEEEDIPKINYGTVSFGNRYSLVSSDCISISSESSLSSFTNSLNDLLDRMGVAPKKEEEGQGDLKIMAPTDEGIFSDERESPSKSCDVESDPSPSFDVETNATPNMMNGHSEGATTPKESPRNEKSLNILESMMDAPSTPVNTKRKRKNDKDEESESESTDASSDDRERRHSCEEFFTDFSFIHSTPNEEKTKRHSFDIAELSSNYNKAKKKNKNKRRFNKIVIFDNFVSSALKAGRFGSLRKSFERLSKIQEDTEELGLLSNESLKDIREPQIDDLLSLSNEEIKQVEEPRNLATNHNSAIINNITQNRIEEMNDDDDGDEYNDDNPLLPLEEMYNELPPVHENTDVPQNIPINNVINERKDKSIDPPPTNIDYSTTNGERNSTPDSNRERSSNDLSEDEFFIEDLKPSRFSTVRRSRDNVPLACCEDFDDNFGSSLEDDINNIDDDYKPPELVSPPSEKDAAFQRHWSVDSNADSESSRDSPNDTINRSLASSGSSIFENFLFLEKDKNAAHPSKRHTFDFGAHRKNNARSEKVKRLGTCSSQYTLPRNNPGSPVWVRKGIYTHRRRKPKCITPQKNNDNSMLIIQEIPV